jgi:hypothetical protein
MVATHLGWSAWDTALGNQLAAHLWQNPTVEDLMESLNPAFRHVGSPPATESMLPWLQRPGFPVITLWCEGSTVHATQQPISSHLPPLATGESSAWWVPLRVSMSPSSPSFLFEFSTASASMPVPAEHLSKSTAAVLLGDPNYLGFFIVRYNSTADWDARIAVAVQDLASKPDYTRALVYHVALLVRMGHEKLDTLCSLLSALGPALATNSVVGGFDGSGDLYHLIATNTAPLASVASAGGVGQALTRTVAAVLGPLATKLGWTASATAPAQHTRAAASAIPWPQHEDAGVDARSRDSLRPLVLLAAVQYGDADTIAVALRNFRGSAASPPAGPEARAEYYAAVR